MRSLRFWWDEVTFASEYSPPQMIEGVMLLLSAAMLLVWWIWQDWQYLLLNLSYVVGAIASMLARQVVAPSAQTRKILQVAGTLLVGLLVGVSMCAAQILHFA